MLNVVSLLIYFYVQLLSEKEGHVKTRRKFESLWVDHDQMRVDYETKIKDLEV